MVLGSASVREGPISPATIAFDSVHVIFVEPQFLYPSDRASRKDKRVADLHPGTVTLTFDTLNLRERKLTSLEGLQEMQELKTLFAQDNFLTSLKHLNQPALETLHVERNRISDFIGLQRLPKLRSIHLEGNAVEQFEMFEIMCSLSLNPDLHKVNGRVISKSERELVALLDRPALCTALKQGWILSTKPLEQSVVDLPADEFFFRLEPAYETYKLQRDPSLNFDIHLNLKRSYEKLAGVPMLISTISRRSSEYSGTHEVSRERRIAFLGEATKCESSLKPKWSIASVRSRQRDYSAFNFDQNSHSGSQRSKSEESNKRGMVRNIRHNSAEKQQVITWEESTSYSLKNEFRSTSISKMKPVNDPLQLGKSISSHPRTRSAEHEEIHYDKNNEKIVAGKELDKAISDGWAHAGRDNTFGYFEDQQASRSECPCDASDANEEVLNWKLSSVDFDSPSKIECLYDEVKLGGISETCSPSSKEPLSKMHLGDQANIESLVAPACPQYLLKGDTDRVQPLAIVECSVPVTQYLVVPSISHEESDVLGNPFPNNGDIAAPQPIHKGPHHTTKDFFFKNWLIHCSWSVCCRNITKQNLNQSTRNILLEWRVHTLYESHCNRSSERINRRSKAIRTLYCLKVGALAHNESNTNLLRVASSVSLNHLPKFRNEAALTLAKSMGFWKDAVRDSKLEQLYSRIRQIETWILMAKQNITNQEAVDEPKRVRSWDKECLESLVEEMLNALDKADDQELKERVVMLLQVVTNVDASIESDP